MGRCKLDCPDNETECCVCCTKQDSCQLRCDDMDKIVEQLDTYITKLVGTNSALYQTVMQIVKGGGVE